MDHKLLAHIIAEIDKLRSDQAIFLSGGGAKDHAEYRHVCGVIRGLTHAEQLVRNLVQKMENYDDE
jgi:hypothetical protein